MGGHLAFINIPALSHVYPSLGLVAELTRRGHRVTYATAPERADLITDTGATLLPYASTRPGDTDPTLQVGTGPGHLGTSLLAFLHETQHILPQLEPALRADPPDLIVHDRMAFVGRILAGTLGVPTVELWPQLISNEHWSMATEVGFDPTQPDFLRYLHELAALLTEQGLPPEPATFLAPVAERHVAFFPRSFQYHGVRFDDRYRFVGACLRDRPGPRWRPPAGGDPVALVSLGSLNNLHLDFYRTCFAAFGGSRWHAVLPVGQRFDPAVLDPVPGNVEVHPVVAQLDVLAHAAVFVSHAGMGGVMEALYAGVPQVVIPFTPEQEMNAARVVELGVGVRLDLAALSPATLRAAVDEAAGNRRIADRITALRPELDAAGGAHAAADAIEEVLKPG